MANYQGVTLIQNLPDLNDYKLPPPLDMDPNLIDLPQDPTLAPTVTTLPIPVITDQEWLTTPEWGADPSIA